MLAPEFLIVVPVHNGATYIQATLDCLLGQTYPHFEVVILENASSDDTLSLIQHYHDPRISILPSTHLLTIEENWARILEVSSTKEFLVIMCADDLLDITFLAHIAALIEAEPHATLYHTHAFFIDDRGDIIGKAKPALEKEDADLFLERLHHFNEDVFGTGYVMRFAHFKQLGGYPAFRRLLFADFYCYYSLTSLGYKACVPLPLMRFRQNTLGVTKQSRLNDFIQAGHQYRQQFVIDTRHLNQDQQRQLDLFVEQFLLVEYRTYLFEIIKHGQQYDKEAFARFKQQFALPNPQRCIFYFDLPLSYYVSLAQLAHTGLAKPGYYLLMAILILRKQFLKKA